MLLESYKLNSIVKEINLKCIKMFVGQYPKYILDICSCYSIIDMGNGCNLDEQSNCVPAVVNSVSINDNQTILLKSENRFIKGRHAQ